MPVHGSDLWRHIGFEFAQPISGYVAIEDDQVISTFGLTWIDGRCWLFFGHTEQSRKHPIAVMRLGKKLLRQADQLGESEVFTPRDQREPSSKRLLGLMGFEFFDHELNPVTGDDEEVYRWQNLQ